MSHMVQFEQSLKCTGKHCKEHAPVILGTITGRMHPHLPQPQWVNMPPSSERTRLKQEWFLQAYGGNQ